MKLLLRVILTILPFVYMGAIWIMSSLPDNVVMELPDDSVDRFIKEGLHLVEFAILYIFFVIALAANGVLSPKLSLLAALAAGFYGIADEIHQSFVPYRSATMIDAAKDWTGVLAAYFHVRYHYFTKNRGFLTYIRTYFH
ncbi:hypothetical protein D0469_15815 [Peribacillus saganii]|uniref:VanZ-like domain-containing protein n=1 Tax=Peribacillus saganii TaxID=2303992 RepID=A0A372LMB0_9BACI|nr:VanZ family protein [Peribacillus saganii]RFU67088.1 hypothetical protein D0469_15815 [Peribacillus saganii]